MTKLRIYLDMDGVLCDFDSAAAIAHGLSPDIYKTHRRNGEWSVLPAISRALNGDEHMTIDEFWEPIRLMGAAFWESLQPTPWYSDLIKLLLPINPKDVYVVTDPCMCDNMELHGSIEGKSRWLKKRFGANYDRMIPTAHKHLLGRTGAVLIDDSETNCRGFRSMGGSSILFPSIGNRKYQEALNNQQIVRVQAELDMIQYVLTTK